MDSRQALIAFGCHRYLTTRLNTLSLEMEAASIRLAAIAINQRLAHYRASPITAQQCHTSTIHERANAMAAKLIIPAVLLCLGSEHASAQSPSRQDLPKFMGRQVTIIEPELDVDGFFSKGPASICIEGPPQRQCYTAPRDFGRNPKVSLVQLEKDLPALLFAAESGGVSGWALHFALLRPGTGNSLEDLFIDVSVSNESQYAFWNDATISAAPIFLTADFVWGPDESHYSEHRYIISAYVWTPNAIVDDARSYYLEDQYLTVRKYDLDANADVLTSEKQEILARLARVKAETERQKQAPH